MTAVATQRRGVKSLKAAAVESYGMQRRGATFWPYIEHFIGSTWSYSEGVANTPGSELMPRQLKFSGNTLGQGLWDAMPAQHCAPSLVAGVQE